MRNEIFRRRTFAVVIWSCLTVLPLAAGLDMRLSTATGLLAAASLGLMLRSVQSEARRTAAFRTRVLIIGRRDTAAKFVEEVERYPDRGYTVLGFVEETATAGTERGGYLSLGPVERLRAIVEAVKPDHILLAFQERRGRLPAAELLEFQMRGIVIEDVLDAYERVSGKMAIETLTPYQLVSSQQLHKSVLITRTQRVMSFSVALVLLVTLAPLMALIALAIRLDSRGPVLFRQRRLGRGARAFDIIKFRTMRPVDQAPSEWERDNANRITPVGRWLRRLRLDELPQLINVLRGDMNLVGPRPHPVSNFPLFRDAIPYYLLRCSIRPGITGWAQVRYHYAASLEEETEKMRYDLHYIKYLTIWTDVRIIAETFGVVVRGLLAHLRDARPETVQRLDGVSGEVAAATA